MKRYLSIIIIFISLSCNNSNKEPSNGVSSYNLKKESSGEGFLKMIFRTKYGCMHIITLDQEGKGMLTKMVSEQRDTFNLWKKSKENIFIIDSKNVMDSINAIALNLGDSVYTMGKNRSDVIINFKLFIGDKLKIETDGDMDSDQYKKLFNLLHPYLPFKIDFYCDGSLVK